LQLGAEAQGTGRIDHAEVEVESQGTIKVLMRASIPRQPGPVLKYRPIRAGA